MEQTDKYTVSRASPGPKIVQNRILQPCHEKRYQLHSYREEGVSTYYFSYSIKSICCGYLLEAPRRGASNKYPQHMFCGEILYEWKSALSGVMICVLDNSKNPGDPAKQYSLTAIYIFSTVPDNTTGGHKNPRTDSAEALASLIGAFTVGICSKDTFFMAI